VTRLHHVSRRRALAYLVLIGVARPVRVFAADDDLQRLFAELGASRERHARFTERKFSAMLKAPAESSGTLVFQSPDILEKRTVEPQRESVRIEGSNVTYEGAPRGGSVQKRTFSLADAPLLAALIESLRATLAGDLVTLRRHYDVAWSALQAPKSWQLMLTPRARALRDSVSKVELRGVAGEVSAIEIVEANGDLTLMQITPMPALARPAKK